MGIKVFISYSRKDRAFARRLARTLHQSGISASSADDMIPGEDWSAHLRRTVSDSSVVIAVMTPGAIDNAHVMSEVGAAVAAHKPVIPIFFAGSGTPPEMSAFSPDVQPIRAEANSHDAVAAAVLERIRGLNVQEQTA
jgi:hypothetical protein